MKRRHFLTSSALAASGVIATSSFFWGKSCERTSYQLGPVSSFEPVVGDGKWIWREPPKEERGYLEPRLFEALTNWSFRKEIESKRQSKAVPADL